MIAAEIDLSPAVVSFLMYTGSERFGLQHWSGVDTDAQGIHIDWRECNFYFFSYLSLFHFIASYNLERVTCSLYEKQGISLYCLMNRGQRECCLGLISCPLRIRNEIPSYPTKREKKSDCFDVVFSHVNHQIFWLLVDKIVIAFYSCTERLPSAFLYWIPPARLNDSNLSSLTYSHDSCRVNQESLDRQDRPDRQVNITSSFTVIRFNKNQLLAKQLR